LTNVNDEQLKQKTDEFIEGQKINGQITDMGNVFKGIVATVGGALVPLFSTLATILSVVMKPISFIAELINAVVSNMWILIPLVTMFAYQMAASAISANAVAIANAGGLAPMIGKAIAGIYSSFMSIPFGMGIPLAIAATAGFISMMTKAKHVGDLKMPAGEGPTVTTAEGGIYKGTKNDDVAMAPGITSKLDDASRLGRAAALPMGVGGFAAGQAINILVNEMKQMRKDFANKSTDVYMDGSKVTANVASNVNKSTRNNFALGQV
jgi:hypothetical protein